MSLRVIYPFIDPLNYSFDSMKIEVDGEARLILEDLIDQHFIQDFASDAGFTYDSTKAEFLAGVLQQKPYVYADEMCGISVIPNADANRALGVKTATANNGAALATIEGKQYLDLSGGVADRYWSYDPANADFAQTGAIRFKVRTGYGVTPPANRFMCLIETTGTGANSINFFHQATGNINLRVNNQAGVLVSSTLHPWIPTVTGVNPYSDEDEIELDFNFDTGGSRVFINGVQSGPTLAGVFSRSTIDTFIIGSSGTSAPDYYFRDFQTFDEEQHTADFAGEVPRYVPNYYGSKVNLPLFTYTGLGELQHFSDLLTTQTGELRYILNGLYFDLGVTNTWIVSDGTILDTTDLATIQLNIDTLPHFDTLQIDFYFQESDVIQDIDNLDMEYIGQLYPVDNPTIEINSSLFADKIDDAQEFSTKPVGTEIKWVVKAYDKWYYALAGVATETDGLQYAESSTISEWATVWPTWDPASAENIKFKAFLHSDAGTVIPALDELIVDFDFQGSPPGEINKSIVFGYNYKSDGTPDVTPFTVVLSSGVVKYKDNVTLTILSETVTPDSEGYWEVELIETDNMASGPNYIFSFTDAVYLAKVAYLDSQNFWDLPGLVRRS